MDVTQAALHAALAATWPPAEASRLGPWTLRAGAGGGRRVAAATAEGPATRADLALLEEGQAALGQPALVMVRADEEALDATLAAAGYARHDPVIALAAPVAHLLAAPAPRLPSTPHWPPLAIAAEIWAEAGIGPARQAVMDRVTGPRCAILGRTGDAPAGAGFAAAHGDIVMIHALAVREQHRRAGCARKILRAAAAWAQELEVPTLSMLVLERNLAARALAASLGMEVVGHYHYRTK